MSSELMSIKYRQGFTLIEVVIATFIVGIALIALAGTVQSLSKQATRIEEIFIANLIANNTLSELQLRQEWPEVGEKEDSLEMANRDWFHISTVVATDVDTLRRVEISVGLNDDRRAISSVLVGFVSNSSQIAQRPVDWLKLNDSNDLTAGEDDSRGEAL